MPSAPQSPDVARMTNTIANYLKECVQQSELGMSQRDEKMKSSTLINNTQMRAHLTTTR